MNSNLHTNNESTHNENSSFENLEEKSMLSAASDMDTDSDSNVSIILDTPEPHVPRAVVDSVTAILAVKK